MEAFGLMGWEIVDSSGAGEVVSIRNEFIALRSGYAFGDSDYTFGEIVNSEITIPEDIHPNLTLQVGANSGDSFQVKLTDA
ncbi:hypothetical protein R0K19_22520, partial [Bacillus sp. SIMBA_161]